MTRNSWYIPILFRHNELLKIEDKTANQIMGSPDDLKLKSSMTLFSLLSETNTVFQAVLNKFYNGNIDSKTLEILGK